MSNFMEYFLPAERIDNVVRSLAYSTSAMFICCILIIIAIFLDMWVGIEAARANGEKIMSKGLRKTINKGLDYLRVVFFAFLIDILGSFFPWYHLPFVSIVATAAILVIEGKSVIENFKRKKSPASEVVTEAQEVVRTLTKRESDTLIQLIKMLGDNRNS